MKKVFIAKSKPNILNHGKKMLFQIPCILSTKHTAQIVDCLLKCQKCVLINKDETLIFFYLTMPNLDQLLSWLTCGLDILHICYAHGYMAGVCKIYTLFPYKVMIGRFFWPTGHLLFSARSISNVTSGVNK